MSNIETSGATGRFTGAIDLGVNQQVEGAEQAAVEQGQQGTEGTEQQPEVIDWEKRYKDAQSELTKLQQEKASAGKPKEAPVEGAAQEGEAEQPTEEGDEPKDGEAGKEEGDEGTSEEQDLEAEVAAKVDVPKYEAEFTKDGKLSDESYAELEAKGFSKDDVDDFIAFRQERNQRFTSAISEEVGGDEAWGDVQAWAKDNMSEADRDAFNKGMVDAAQKRDLAAARLLAAGVMQRYEEANGHGSRRSATSGAAGEGGSEGGYATKAEWQAEMRSEGYRSDPSMRARVDAKLQNSAWFKAQNGL